jgi:hypothetical protein
MQMQHGRNDGEAVVDPVVNFLDQHCWRLSAWRRLPSMRCRSVGHAKDIGDALQKNNVVVGELAFRPAIEPLGEAAADEVSAVSCGSAASQPAIAARCVSSFDSRRTLVL